jgi:hypothetical protein
VLIFFGNKSAFFFGRLFSLPFFVLVCHGIFLMDEILVIVKSITIFEEYQSLQTSSDALHLVTKGARASAWIAELDRKTG